LSRYSEALEMYEKLWSLEPDDPFVLKDLDAIA
jgi:hypothetical protein